MNYWNIAIGDWCSRIGWMNPDLLSTIFVNMWFNSLLKAHLDTVNSSPIIKSFANSCLCFCYCPNRVCSFIWLQIQGNVLIGDHQHIGWEFLSSSGNHKWICPNYIGICGLPSTILLLVHWLCILTVSVLAWTSFLITVMVVVGDKMKIWC